MRLTKILLMLVIGMITCTAQASTPVPREKQKAPVLLKITSVDMVADVLPVNVLLVVSDATVYNPLETYVFTSKKFEPVQHWAIVTDVGWSFNPEQYKQVPFVEKLNLCYLPDHKKRLRYLGIDNARDNC